MKIVAVDVDGFTEYTRAVEEDRDHLKLALYAIASMKVDAETDFSKLAALMMTIAKTELAMHVIRMQAEADRP